MEQDEISHEDEIFSGDEEKRLQREGEAEAEKYIHACIEKLSQLLSLKETEDIPDISAYKIAADLQTVAGEKFFLSSETHLPLYVIASYYDNSETRYYDSATVVGIVELREEYPLTSLHKESFNDRLVDLFTKTDIDFKDQKKFSSTFHLISTDEDRIRSLWDNKQLDILADFPLLVVEINGRYCVYRILKNDGISEEHVIAFAAVTRNLLKILS